MAGTHPLRKFRLSQKPALTQEALGKEIGVTGQTVWRWENGDRQVSREYLSKIKEVTGIRPSTILEFEMERAE
jgi:transcriptional regulator with XRE-family HTH domain